MSIFYHLSLSLPFPSFSISSIVLLSLIIITRLTFEEAHNTAHSRGKLYGMFRNIALVCSASHITFILRNEIF
jgi:hypothetical protein